MREQGANAQSSFVLYCTSLMLAVGRTETLDQLLTEAIASTSFFFPLSRRVAAVLLVTPILLPISVRPCPSAASSTAWRSRSVSALGSVAARRRLRFC